VGSAGTSIPHIHSLYAGTQLQSDPLQAYPFELLIEGRFGLGDFSGDPATFWGAPPPSGISNLYSISIFENPTQHIIDASVNLINSPTSDFSFVFAKSATEIENLIRGANWTLAGDKWTLNENLPLIDLTITTLNASHSGSDATIGVRVKNESLAVVVPEPSFNLGVFALGTLGAASTLNRKLKPSKSTEKETTKVG
jgi:hypothetical protein